MYLKLERAGDTLALRLTGEWRSPTLAAVNSELEALELGQARSLTCDVSGASFDLSGAWLPKLAASRSALAARRRTGWI
jgi:hypothetical protein